LADYPTDENKGAFYQALQFGRVGIRAEEGIGPLPNGEYVTTEDTDVRIPIAGAPNGESMLVVLANVKWLKEREPASVFVEFDASDVLRIACNAGAGLIVQVAGPRRQAWAGVSKGDVARLAAGAWQGKDKSGGARGE
jgi:hypothetical protein